MTKESPRRDPSDLDRRNFLKLSATGLAASMAGAAAPLEASSAPRNQQQAQEPPSADDVVDPKNKRIETWQEPWVWRPDDWPDINPMWVTRIDVPDETGALHNILEEPRWMDRVPIPP